MKPDDKACAQQLEQASAALYLVIRSRVSLPEGERESVIRIIQAALRFVEPAR